ncbi:hypothetical protein SERLA73DRAFT_175302 [Serpula lacrymans var. lacrymans S7.3]|uniref:Uncharacterized protein n=1 Tax=Serpula lacrymans var. lacrymans (strain S7.3) TaxID=936435 RepID=F8PIR7_SERL3|nr:hypothetical protein SERLA73DRAFT_175302 [Serpula lacrymans var. lacrymans S7.3]
MRLVLVNALYHSPFDHVSSSSVFVFPFSCQHLLISLYTREVFEKCLNRMYSSAVFQVNRVGLKISPWSWR